MVEFKIEKERTDFKTISAKKYNQSVYIFFDVENNIVNV